MKVLSGWLILADCDQILERLREPDDGRLRDQRVADFIMLPRPRCQKSFRDTHGVCSLHSLALTARYQVIALDCDLALVALNAKVAANLTAYARNTSP
jgi:hypothetical protein